MSEPKRLHPIAALINTIRQLKEMLIPFIVFVVFGSRGANGNFYYLVGSIGILLLVVIFGILSWYKFSYRVENGELRIEHGLFIRKKRYIPFERIQSLDVSEGIFQRLFGLVKVKVETAGGAGRGEAEAVLTAITKDESNRIHEMLISIKESGKVIEVDRQGLSIEGKVIYKISHAELLLLASTSGGVGVVISAVFAFVFQFEEFIPYEKVFKEVEGFVASGFIFISLLIFVGFLLAWLISVVGTMFKYADFTVKKVDNDLVITRGLLEKRQFTIPLKRIQAIRISENLLRQPLGLASVFVESAGGSAVNQESSKVLIVPIIKRQKIAAVLGPYIEDYQLTPQLISAPRRAFRRYLLRGWIYIIPIVIAVSFFFRPWGYLSILLIPTSAFWSWLEFKDAGWCLNRGLLTLRLRNIVKTTIFMKREKIQSLSAKQSHFQRRMEVATIDATVKSGQGGSGGKVIDLEKNDVETIYQWYSRKE